MTGQIVWTLLVRALLIAAGFFSSIITARLLGPEGRGMFFYWTSLAALIIQFGNLGLHSSNTYYLAKGQASLSQLGANSLVVSISAGTFLGGLLTGILWINDPFFSIKWSFLIPTLLMVPSGLYFLLGTNLLVGLGRVNEYNGFELANRYAGLVALLLSLWIWHTPESLLIAISITGIIMCLPLYLRLKRIDGKSPPSLALIRKGFGYAIRAYVICALGFMLLRLNVILLERYTNSSILGTWSIAAQLLDVINVLPSTMALVLLPKIMRTDDPHRMMRSQLTASAIILFIVCLLAAGLGKGFISLLYGQRFKDAYEMLLWGLPGALGLGLTSILSQYLAAEGIPVSLIWVWLTGLIIEASLALWLIPKHGGTGAMISLSAAYLVVLGLVWILVEYTEKKKVIFLKPNVS